VRRRDKEIIDIGECAPLDAVIERLHSLHASLSGDAQAMVSVEGCDYFGWRLTVTYFREATAEEFELEARYMSSRLPKQPRRLRL
jgi:hypothetical protein